MSLETSLKNQKAILRNKARALRRNIGVEERRNNDRAIQHFLVELVEQYRPQMVSAYGACDGEPDLLPVLKMLMEKKIAIAMPLIRPCAGVPALIFRQWTTTTSMKNSRYGTPEPVGTEEVSLADIDMVLLPLVAWDISGGRLGMGGGFYDRALQPFRKVSRPMRIGVAYQLQMLPQLATDPWDVPLHKVVSETGIHHVDTQTGQTSI